MDTTITKPMSSNSAINPYFTKKDLGITSEYCVNIRGSGPKKVNFPPNPGIEYNCDFIESIKFYDRLFDRIREENTVSYGLLKEIVNRNVSIKNKDTFESIRNESVRLAYGLYEIMFVNNKDKEFRNSLVKVINKYS